MDRYPIAVGDQGQGSGDGDALLEGRKPGVSLKQTT